MQIQKRSKQIIQIDFHGKITVRPYNWMPAKDIVSLGNVNKNNSSKASRYRPEIDGLKAFAVAAVIINHFSKDILPGGYLGVDIFFVISGYVITSSLFGRPSKDFKDFITGFYERRIKRLVPALTVFVLITSIAICLFNPSPGTSLRTGLNSLFGLSNLYLLRNSIDYFAKSTELNVFTHTWSLGVEEQFYILFPFLTWFSGFGRSTKNGARNLFLIVGTMTIASLVGFLYLYPTNQPVAYFLMPSRFWEMAAGCLIFIGFQKRASVEQFLEKVPPFLVLVLIVGVMYLPMSMAATSTIAVVALSSILIASLKKQTAAFKVFTHPRVVYIGLISYSLYLWHWGVISISRWTIGIHWWSVPFQVALMLGLAVVSYRWIETPLRKGNWFGRRWKTFVGGGGVLLILAGGLIALGKPLKGRLFAGNPPVPSHIKHLFKPDGYQSSSCSIFAVNSKATSLNSVCGHYISKNLPTVYILGDSHASIMGDILSSESRNRKTFNVVSVWGNYCQFPPAVRSSYDHPALKGLDCYDNQKKVEEKLLSVVSEGDLVLIASFSIDQFVIGEKNPFAENSGGTINFETPGNDSISPKNAQKMYFQKLNSFTNELRKLGVNTTFYANAGRFLKGSGDICYSEWKKQWYRPLGGEQCLYPKQNQISMYRQQFDEDINNWIEINDSNYLLDAFDVGICRNEFCDGSYIGDTQHLKIWAFAYLVEEFLEENNL